MQSLSQLNALCSKKNANSSFKLKFNFDFKLAWLAICTTKSFSSLSLLLRARKKRVFVAQQSPSRAATKTPRKLEKRNLKMSLICVASRFAVSFRDLESLFCCPLKQSAAESALRWVAASRATFATHFSANQFSSSKICQANKNCFPELSFRCKKARFNQCNLDSIAQRK